MVMDFKDAKKDLDGILKGLDHFMLLEEGDVAIESLAGEDIVTLPFKPTSENLARYIYNELCCDEVVAVELHESDTSMARYTCRQG